MKIINPTDKDVTIAINGSSYEIAAGGELSNMDPKVAAAWKKVHGFLTLEDDMGVANLAAPVVEDETTEDDVTPEDEEV